VARGFNYWIDGLRFGVNLSVDILAVASRLSQPLLSVELTPIASTTLGRYENGFNDDPSQTHQ